MANIYINNGGFQYNDLITGSVDLLDWSRELYLIDITSATGDVFIVLPEMKAQENDGRIRLQRIDTNLTYNVIIQPFTGQPLNGSTENYVVLSQQYATVEIVNSQEKATSESVLLQTNENTIIGGNAIIQTTPTLDNHAATVAYVNSAISGAITAASSWQGTFSGTETLYPVSRPSGADIEAGDIFTVDTTYTVGETTIYQTTALRAKTNNPAQNPDNWANEGEPDNKQDKVPTADMDNFATWDSAGNTKDSGLTITTDPDSNDNTHIMTAETVQTAIASRSSVSGLNTTLSTPLTATATVAGVVSTAGFPPHGGVFYVDSEAIYYADLTATAFTGLIRNYNSTTAAVHASGAAVTSIDGAPYNNGTLLTTLTAGISATDTSIIVESTDGFASSGILYVGNEAISYAIKILNTFISLTRGVNNTTASAHNAGTLVSSLGLPYPVTGTGSASWIGMISAFVGNIPPQGAFFCDGSAISRITYAGLFAVIGTSHGNGNGTTTFNIPDYRGRFLRGVDGTANRDPDKGTRTAMNTGGDSGNATGSVQASTFASHTHAIHGDGFLSTNPDGSAYYVAVGNSTLPAHDVSATATATGGSETRPINAYVNYIIWWDTPPGNGDVYLANSNAFTGANTFAGTSTFNNSMISNLSTVSGVYSTVVLQNSDKQFALAPANPMALASGVTAGDILTTSATGQATDSGKTFGNDGTNNTIPNSAQMQSYVTTALLNTPTLPPVNFATTANDTLVGYAARDGVTPTAGMFALIKNQTNNDNSVYQVAATALLTWTRCYNNSGTWTPITTQTTYSQLNINGGVLNVLAGTVNKNLQYQFNIVNPAATFGTTTVYVTALTKLPVASTSNVYVDAVTGNNTNNNGSQSFPLATITAGIAGITNMPATINLMSNSTFSDTPTWTGAKTNITIQGINLADVGGTQTISGQQTFGSGSTYIHYVNTYHSTGATAPFAFASGALCRNNLKNITIASNAADWLGLNAGVFNFIRLNNINFQTVGINAINLPAFTNPFSIYIEQQDLSKGFLLFTGTGAANTNVIIESKVLDSQVRLPSTYVGNIIWAGAFSGTLGSPAHPVGLITTQADLTTVLNWITDTTYDGYYAITGFTPTTFSAGAIFGKQTVAGFGTNLWWARTPTYNPATIRDGTTIYQFNKSTNTWSTITGGAPFETNASNIVMDGTASVGTLSTVPRADHVHPSDTSRASITGNNAMTGNNTYAGTSTFNNSMISSLSNASGTFTPIVLDSSNIFRKQPPSASITNTAISFLGTPPASPNLDDTYVVQSGTGAWAGHDTQIATWNGAAWGFYIPSVNDIVSLINGDLYQFNGSAWATYSQAGGSFLKQTITSSITLTAWQKEIRVNCTNASIVVNIPQALAANVTQEIVVTRIDNNTNYSVSIAAYTGQTINGVSTIWLYNQWDSIKLSSNGSLGSSDIIVDSRNSGGTGTMSYLKAYVVNQTTGLTAGSAILYNNAPSTLPLQSYGTAITMLSNGRVQLAAGNTYEIEAYCGNLVCSDYIEYQLYNVDTSTGFGNRVLQSMPAGNSNQGETAPATHIMTPNVTTIIQTNILQNSGVTVIGGDGSTQRAGYIKVKQLNSPASVINTKEYLQVAQTANVDITTVGQVLSFPTVVMGNIPWDGTQATLIAGKTYKIIFYPIATGTVNADIKCYNATTSSYFGSPWVVYSTQNYDIGQPVIVTPTQTIKMQLQVSKVNAAGSVGDSPRGAPIQLVIEQIGSSEVILSSTSFPQLAKNTTGEGAQGIVFIYKNKLWQMGAYGTSGGSAPGNCLIPTVVPVNNTGNAITGWSDVVYTYDSAIALTTDGRVFTWGYNNPTQVFKPVATLVGGLTGITISKIYCAANRGGNYVNSFYMISNIGALYVFGDNSWGQLGIGSSTAQTTAQLVGGALAGKVITKVSVGGSDGMHVAVIDSTGQLYTCGYGVQGSSPTCTPLGTGVANTSYNTFQTISGFTNVVDVACAGQYINVGPTATNFTRILRANGTTWASGANNGGQLGLTGQPNTSTFAQESLGKTNIVAIYVFETYVGGCSAIIDNAGILYLAGNNNDNCFGDGSTNNSVHNNFTNTTQLQNAGFQGKMLIGSAGIQPKILMMGNARSGYNTLVVLDNTGTVWAVGRGDEGQLGNGTAASTTAFSNPIAGYSGLPVIDIKSIGYTSADRGLLLLFQDGTMMTAGKNNTGALGSETTVANQPVPYFRHVIGFSNPLI